MKKWAFSGVQPSGELHIGNYLGAIRNWVEDQERYECIFCVVDLHAITVYQEPSVLREKIREVAKIYLAAGIDPNRATIFVQSHIPAHAELAWILNTITPMGWLYRMTQFKEKSTDQKENVGVGLFDYPVLMASDILLYQAHCVPVGEDQRQHIELTRDVAQRFNRLFGETFVVPEAVIREAGARVMGLDDPTKKMSKSNGSPFHSIGLLDEPDAIRKKLARAVTDSLREIRFDPTRPGIYNLLTIYQILSGETKEGIERRFEGKGYAEFKRELADRIIESLRPLQQRYRELSQDPRLIENILREGAARVEPIAHRTLKEVKEKLGLG